MKSVCRSDPDASVRMGRADAERKRGARGRTAMYPQLTSDHERSAPIPGIASIRNLPSRIRIGWITHAPGERRARSVTSGQQRRVRSSSRGEELAAVTIRARPFLPRPHMMTEEREGDHGG